MLLSSSSSSSVHSVVRDCEEVELCKKILLACMVSFLQNWVDHGSKFLCFQLNYVFFHSLLLKISPEHNLQFFTKKFAELSLIAKFRLHGGRTDGRTYLFV